MAFVFRAKRDLKLSNLEQNNLSPGEFYRSEERRVGKECRS